MDDSVKIIISKQADIEILTKHGAFYDFPRIMIPELTGGAPTPEAPPRHAMHKDSLSSASLRYRLFFLNTAGWLRGLHGAKSPC